MIATLIGIIIDPEFVIATATVTALLARAL